MNISKKHKILFIILTVAFLLRVPSIIWGVPFFNEHATMYDGDEPKLVMAALKFPPTLSVMPHPTFYHYFLGLISTPVKKIIPFSDAQSFLFIYFTLFFYIRLITLVLGVACVYATYGLGRKMYDDNCGLLAAALVSVSMIHIMYSVMAIVYVPLSLIIIAGFYKLFDLNNDSGIKDFVLLGILTGLMMGTKFTGALFFVPLLMYVAFMPKKGADRIHIIWKLGLTVLVAGIVLCITTPTLFNRAGWAKIFVEIKELSAGEGGLLRLNLWKANFVDLVRAVGFPLACLFLSGVFYPIKKNLKELSLLSLIIGLYVYFDHGVSPKYTIVVIPVFALLAARFVVLLSRKTKMKKFLVAVIAFVFIYSILHDITAIFLRLDDTRTQASEFIDNNVSAGTTVGVAATSEKYPWRYHKWRYPFIDFRKYKEKYFLEYPEILVLSSFDYDAFERGTPISDPDGWYRFSPPSQEIYDFYLDILSGNSAEYELVKTFKKPDIIYIDMPSPEIRVYRKVAGR